MFVEFTDAERNRPFLMSAAQIESVHYLSESQTLLVSTVTQRFVWARTPRKYVVQGSYESIVRMIEGRQSATPSVE